METETSSHERQEWMQPISWKLLIQSRIWASIFKVPNKLRNVNEDAYSPRIVSIGPFHSSTITSPLLRQISANKVDHGRAEEDDKWRHMLSLVQQTLVKKHDHLQAMEDHKWRYTLNLICRTMSPKETLDECGATILGRDQEVRGSYAGNIKLQPHELAEIMLIDGCFILELFIRSYWHFTEKKDGDHIFHKAWMVSLRRDLTLLENQIPFFILQELYNIVVPKFIPAEHLGSIPITELALFFFYPDLISNKGAILGDELMDFEHLLGLLHRFYLPTYPKADQEDKGDLKSNHEALFPERCDTSLDIDQQTWGFEAIFREKSNASLDIDPEDQQTWGFEAKFREKRNASLDMDPGDQQTWGFGESATQLLEAGIEFEKGSEEHFLDRAWVNMEFDVSNGVIKMPKLRIDETTESLLRNLIALEQCKPRSRCLAFSSYAILMTSLVRSQQDIRLLEERDIIATNLGEIKNVFDFFKNVSMGVVLEDFYFGKLLKVVKEYRKSGWNLNRIMVIPKLRGLRYLEYLKYFYFPIPWNDLISLISSVNGLVILNILTILQTFYTIKSYYAGVDPH